jgi:hypothetical protein
MDPELRAVMERVDAVERASFISLYEDAPPELNAGLYEEGPALAAWLGSYEDAGFSAIFDFGDADDPEATLERLLRVMAQAGARVAGVEDNPDLDPQYNRQWFESRGFKPDFDEQIWWRPLAGFQAPPEPPGVRIERATRGDGATFARVLNEGFGSAPDAGLGRVYASVIDKGGWLHYLAYVDGEPGAAAALFIADGVADCFIASTRPQARQRGAQTALISRRLADGLDAGCDIATAQSVTDNASPRNFERHGFMPVYRRTIYARRLDELLE